MATSRVLIALAIGATVVVRAQPPQLPGGPHVVTGRVVEITSDAPVAGAAVTLTMPDTSVDRVARPPARNVMTTPDGYFVFRDLAAGKYVITTTAFGYYRNDYPQQIVEIKDDSKVVNATLRVWRHASISGRVFDERGEPVVGVPVYALRRLAIGGRLVLRQEYADAETDDRGVYRLADLPPGRYVVGALSSSVSMPASLAESLDAATSVLDPARRAVSRLLPGSANTRRGDGLRLGDVVMQRVGPAPALSPDGRFLTDANTLFPGAANAADATVITLASGDSRTDVDIPVRFVPSVRVSGVVTGPEGPMEHVAVRLAPPAAADVTSFDAVGVVNAVTDAGGRFAFLAVPAGQYELRAAYIAQASQTNPRSVALFAARPLTVGDSDVAGVQVTMTTGVRLSGRVEFKAAEGTPASAFDGVSIILRPVDAQSWSAAYEEVRPDRTFATVGELPGKYEIYAAGAASWRVVAATTGGRSLPDYTIGLEDRDITDVVLTLSNTSRKLSGTVTDPKGAVDPDADVIVFPADTAVWREGVFQSRRVQRVRASSAGAFAFPSLAPGDYYLAAVNARFTLDWLDPDFLERLLPGATKVTLVDGDDKTIALKTFTPKVR